MPPEQIPAQEQLQNHHWKRYLWAILVIPIVIGGVYIFPIITDPCFGERYQGEELGPRCAESLVPEQTAESNLMSDWQTYRNEEYGFEVEIPKDWMVNKDTRNSFGEKINFVSQKTLEEYEDRLSICNDCDIGAVPIDVYFSTISAIASEHTETVYINEKRWTKYFGLDMFDTVHFVLESENKNYHFVGIGRQTENTLTEILSTFRFTESIDISNWQTYQDSYLEFKYPNDWNINDRSSSGILTIKRAPDGSGGFDLYKDFSPNVFRQSEDLTGYCKISMGMFDEDFFTMTNELENEQFINISGQVEVGGKEGIRGFATELQYIPFLYIPYSNTETLSISLYAGSDVLDGCGLTLNQILSTFKFTK